MQQNTRMTTTRLEPKTLQFKTQCSTDWAKWLTHQLVIVGVWHYGAYIIHTIHLYICLHLESFGSQQMICYCLMSCPSLQKERFHPARLTFSWGPLFTDSLSLFLSLLFCFCIMVYPLLNKSIIQSLNQNILCLSLIQKISLTQNVWFFCFRLSHYFFLLNGSSFYFGENSLQLKTPLISFTVLILSNRQGILPLLGKKVTTYEFFMSHVIGLH